MLESTTQVRQGNSEFRATLPAMVQDYVSCADWYDRGLIWLDDINIGFLEVTNEKYDDSYFDHYARLEALPISEQITDARMQLVRRHTRNRVLDFGVGSGTFVRSLSGTTGYDINPKSVAWLKDRKLFVDPWKEAVPVITFWDSIEHVRDFAPLLTNVTEWVFISVPIFTGAMHALRSKHFKPTEHYWYFTMQGLINLMCYRGFMAMEVNWNETRLGRDQVLSFAFKRYPSGD